MQHICIIRIVCWSLGRPGGLKDVRKGGDWVPTINIWSGFLFISFFCSILCKMDFPLYLPELLFTPCLPSEFFFLIANKLSGWAADEYL